VFVTFVLALALNFVGIAGYQCYLDGQSLWRKTREVFAPVLPAELFSALLTTAAVYLAVRLGTVGIALFALVLIVFQYLVGELLRSKQRGEDLRRVATTDELTGLANREHFNARLQERIDAAQRTGSGFGVMLMDLDRFKEINDTLGHHYGDVLLRELGPRLASCVGPDGFVARLGGDEFAVLPDVMTDDPSWLEELAGRLLSLVQMPCTVDELTIEVGASLGISRFPHDGRDVHALIRSADVAMYSAKEAQTGCKLYAAEHDRNSVRRLSVLSDVRRALAAGEIVVHYQPIVRVADRRVRGAEALVRWQHPELGLLAPGAFIPTVEQTGLIGPLTANVLEQAVAQCASWRSSGHELTVAVNLSVRNLLDRNLPAQIAATLAAHDVDPGALRLEITESMIMSDRDRVLATVSRLSALGLRISVDDFGTGYSSLAILRRLPIDELKIDRSFVSPMLTDESDLIIVRSTINLGHDLRLRVIAEGVEDEGTLERLAALGCDQAQGFHISTPLAPDEFAAWIDGSGVVAEAA
jgi:diguanylate cyclase (GGDEF)-like protein